MILIHAFTACFCVLTVLLLLVQIVQEEVSYLLWFKINYYSGIPVYQQIIAGFEEAVISGKLKADEPIPSIRELGKKLKVNPNTIARAYRDLETSGYVYSRPGIGYFIAAQNEEAIAEKALSLIRGELADTILTAKKYKISSEELKGLVVDLIAEVYGGE